MRDLTIEIPDGWFWKVLLLAVLLGVCFMLFSWWAIKLDAAKIVETAHAEAEARAISGHCEAVK